MNGAHRLRELATLFTRLGFTAFGGPAAHVALIEDEVVTRRKWLDRTHFLDIVSAVNFIPGPNSTELAIHIGQLRAGFPGLLVAGACFIFPAVLIILPIAWAYVNYGALPQVQPVLRAISAAIVAVVIVATWRFARTGLKDGFTVVICAGVMIAAPMLRRFAGIQPEIPLLAAGAILGALVSRGIAGRIPMLAITPEFLLLGAFFLKVGATLFGSGYVLVSYLQSGLVQDYQWLSQRQLLDAIAVGQFTPGPLLTTATFVGFVVGHDTFQGGNPGGLIGALVATVAIFLPAFVLVAIFGPMLQRIRENKTARAALDGMNAAVVGLMIVVAIELGFAAVVRADRSPDWLNQVILALCTALLLRKINATWLILAAGAVGYVIALIKN